MARAAAAGGGHQGGQRSPGGRQRRGAGLQARKQRRLHLGAAGLQGGRQRPDRLRPAVSRLLNAVTTAALDAALLGKADASALASLLSTVDGLDTPLEVDTKIANALLGLATEAFVAAQLASRDAGVTALQASKADAALLASYATNAALSASKTALQSALDAILAELAALQLSGSGVVNAPAWAGFATWELLRGSSVVLHFVAPLSAALANGDDTLSITAAKLVDTLHDAIPNQDLSNILSMPRLEERSAALTDAAAIDLPSSSSSSSRPKGKGKGAKRP